MKHNPWKPSLDTLEAWRSLAASWGVLVLCTMILWFTL